MSVITIQDLRDSADVLIAAHRGHRFGVVAENTLRAYDLALALGADMLEVDAARAKDGRYFVLHGPLLETVSDQTGDIHDKTSDALQSLRLLSAYGCYPPAPLLTLEDALENYRGRALINIDRAYTLPELEDTYQIAARMGMTKQILFKAPLCVDRVLPWLRERPDAAYMPIIRNDADEMRRVLAAAREMRFPAIEITFRDENMSIFAPETVHAARQLGMKPLVNAMTMLSEPLSGGHDDETSLLRGRGAGWGWLIDRGAAIIQTDCTGELKHYIKEREALQNENNR